MNPAISPNRLAFSGNSRRRVPHPVLTPRRDGGTYLAAMVVGAAQTMNTRTQFLVVAAVAKAHRWTGSPSCEWTSAAVATTEFAPEMSRRGGDRGPPDLMRP